MLGFVPLSSGAAAHDGQSKVNTRRSHFPARPSCCSVHTRRRSRRPHARAASVHGDATSDDRTNEPVQEDAESFSSSSLSPSEDQLDDGGGGTGFHPEGSAERRRFSADHLFRVRLALRRAVSEERYADAARLRDELSAVRRCDPLLRARDDLEHAVQNEDYAAAARLRDRVGELISRRALWGRVAGSRTGGAPAAAAGLAAAATAGDEAVNATMLAADDAGDPAAVGENHAIADAAVHRVNRLVHLLVNAEGRTRVITSSPQGSVVLSLTPFSEKQCAFAQPTWSPSSDFVSVTHVCVTANPTGGASSGGGGSSGGSGGGFFSLGGGAKAVRSRLVVLDVLDGKTVQSREVESSPFYFFWSPCGRVVTYLGGQSGRLQLYALRVHPPQPKSVLLDEGAPYFLSFYTEYGDANAGGDGAAADDAEQRRRSSSSSLVAIHVGSRSSVDVFDIRDGASGASARTLSTIAGDFRAPQWHPLRSNFGNPQVLFVEKRGDCNVIVCTDVVTSVRCDLCKLAESAVSFTLSPNGGRMAMFMSAATGSEKLLVIDGPFDADEQFVKQHAAFTPSVDLSVPFSRTLAFFWSPDSRKLLYLSCSSSSLAIKQCRWNVYDFSTNTLARFEEHIPSRIFVQQCLPFFDQYAQSQRLWSPDSCAFCYAGRSERFGGSSAPSFAWVQHLPAEMLHGEAAPGGAAPAAAGDDASKPPRSPNARRRRVISAQQAPMPEPVMRDSELCTWSLC